MNLILKPQTNLIDWAFDDFFNDDFFSANNNYPRVDVREEDKQYTLEADIPGLTEKELDIKVDGNLLTISSQHNEKEQEKHKNYLIKERKSQTFTRSFVLPKNVDTTSIKANYKNGHLELTIPKTEAAKPKQIEINSK